MPLTDRIPIFYDGQDRSKSGPVSVKTRHEIKLGRRSGELNGSYVDNGNAFMIYRPLRIEQDFEEIINGSGFDTAWHIKQSGYAGPNVWQLKSFSPYPTI